MKILRTELINIVREELSDVMSEFMCHNKKGHFAKCKKGNTYSLSDKGADSRGVSKELVKRGNVQSVDDDGSVNVSAKYGLNTSDKKQGGRIEMTSGDSISPQRYVSKYPKKYYTEDLDEDADKGVEVKCRRAGYERPEQTLRRFLTRTALASKAVKGEYPDRPESK